MTVQREPASAIVQEAFASERVVVLKVRVPGRTALVVVAASRGTQGAGLLTSEARQRWWAARLPAGITRTKHREAPLVGARVLAVEETAALLDQGGAKRVLRAHGERVVVTDAEASSSSPSLVSALEDEDIRASLEARGEKLARALAEEALELQRREALRLLDRARLRIERRARAVRGDLEKIEAARVLAAQAQWLVPEAARTPRGARELVVTDWSTGEAVPVRIPLDPSKTAKDQVEAMFKRAKRLRAGGRVAEERLAQTHRQAAAIAQVMEAVARAQSLGELDEALRDAKRAAPRDVALPGAGGGAPVRASSSERRLPYRTFFARSGRKVLVGRGAVDNDALTLKVARPHDLWLHAKERAGAHVIVPLDKGHTCPGEDLVDAAHLAAHFSDAKGEAVVDVEYAPRRYLRKPKGSPAGLVVVDREKVLALRVDDGRLRELLEREDV